MTLQLLNEYTSHNLGDAAVYETMVQLAAPKPLLTSLTNEQSCFVRGLCSTEPTQPPTAWVSVGGDIFNNARPTLITRNFLQNVLSLAAAPPEQTFLFGQSIPSSCRGISFSLLARVLRQISSVTVRDSHSYRRLRAVGVDADLSYDIAMAYRPLPGCAAAGRSLLALGDVTPERAVLISLRAFDAMYPHNNQHFLARLAEVVQRLIARGHQPAVLCQSAAVGADSDQPVIAQLRQLVPHLTVLNPFAKEMAAHHPLDALVGSLMQANAVVAVRYHTAIFRLLSGRVPYSLYYSNKGQDLVQRLGLPGTSLAQFDPTQVVHAIEASADRGHDLAPQAEQVQRGFAAALNGASRSLHHEPSRGDAPRRFSAR
jgi:polysaccharide pyruvyl transferase WcaK-like protein